MKSRIRTPLLAFLLVAVLFSCMTRTTLLHVAHHEHVVMLSEEHGVSHVILYHPADSHSMEHEPSNLNHGDHDHEFHVSDLTAIVKQRATSDGPAQAVSKDFQRLMPHFIAFDFAFPSECDVGTWDKPPYILRI